MIEFDRTFGSRIRQCGLLLAALGAAVLVGCGGGGDPNTARVYGSVTIDGQPVPNDAVATITFRPLDASSGRTTGTQVTDGKYVCPDVPRGSVKAYIQIIQPTGRTVEMDGRMVPETRNLIAERYSSTGIDLEIDSRSVAHDFELESQ